MHYEISKDIFTLRRLYNLRRFEIFEGFVPALVCMYACIYMCMFACVCIWCVWSYICVYVCMCMFVRECVCVCLYVCVCVYVCVLCVHAYMHVCLSVHVQTINILFYHTNNYLHRSKPTLSRSEKKALQTKRDYINQNVRPAKVTINVQNK